MRVRDIRRKKGELSDGGIIGAGGSPHWGGWRPNINTQCRKCLPHFPLAIISFMFSFWPTWQIGQILVCGVCPYMGKWACLILQTKKDYPIFLDVQCLSLFYYFANLTFKFINPNLGQMSLMPIFVFLPKEINYESATYKEIFKSLT